MHKRQQTADSLRDFVTRHPRLAVLTGAGISASSGIPTYRDANGTWQHSRPIQHQEFLASPPRRRRYWARSMMGWPGVRDARPNVSHLALATLERLGHVELVITQNVDRLHQRAGSEAVVDLHGRLDRVKCLDCGEYGCREAMQARLLQCNAGFDHRVETVRPDGDAELPDEALASVAIPPCLRCGGTLMPDVVFFGGTVPRHRVNRGMAAVERADALLVVGSSLQVYSGFRFCKRAAEMGKPVAIVNPGATRADDMATLKLPVDCGPLLSAICDPG